MIFKGDAMSSIQGVTSTPPVKAPQVQKPVVQPAPVNKNRDGEVQKPRTADRDKGNKIDVQA